MYAIDIQPAGLSTIFKTGLSLVKYKTGRTALLVNCYLCIPKRKKCSNVEVEATSGLYNNSSLVSCKSNRPVYLSYQGGYCQGPQKADHGPDNVISALVLTTLFGLP